MKTTFSLDQLADAAIEESERVLRACVHCGFCLSSCPTYTLLGDELDSPRGRIYLIKDMLETGKTPTPKVVKHLDRCLSCLSCQSICPSNVTYMHLIDHARVHIDHTYKRPFFDRVLRDFLGWLFLRPRAFAMSLRGARLGKVLSFLAPGRLGGMMKAAPKPDTAKTWSARTIIPAEGERRARVVLLQGCVQQAVGGSINEATIRLLTRHGCEVVILPEAYCCGSITHHQGREDATLDRVRTNVSAWSAERGGDGLDAIVINASGCGTHVKDYGFLLRDDPAFAERGIEMAALAKDVSEFLTDLDIAGETRDLRVAYQSACSMQHGQKVHAQPVGLLRRAGFEVVEPKEPHMCCGSAGTYSLLQPEIATRLRDRKVEKLSDTTPDVIASGNAGCMVQLASGTGIPVVHTVELLDWATGGPKPKALNP